jgi:hypothetical protein
MFDFLKRSGKFEHPTCYKPNDDPYPLCKGADNPVEFAEHVIYTRIWMSANTVSTVSNKN